MRAVNLIPSDERRRGASVGAGRSQGVAYVVLGVLAGVAVLVLLYGVARHHASSRRSQLATIAAETQREQEALSALTPYTSFIALREARMKAVADVVDSRFDWAHAFHELGRVLPRDTSITSLDGTVGAPGSTSGSSSSSSSSSTAAGSATPVGSVPTITLGGCASSQSEVALTLQRLRLIDGVGDVSLKSSAKGGGSSSSSSSGQCSPKSPSFSVQITFDPLPAAASEAASKASTQLTASTGGGQ